MSSDPLRHHGDLEEAELRGLGRDASSLGNFSVNVSFVPPHESVLEAIRTADPISYPDRGMLLAREAVGLARGRSADEVLIGAGAAELLWASIRALADSSSPMLVLGPTFTEPEAAARAAKVPIVELRSRPELDFVHDRLEIAAAIERHRPSLVSLSRPNNPSGTAIPFDALHALIDEHPKTIFLVDESFLSLSTLHDEASQSLPGNALRFRSMTKDHALAGVRVGSVFGAPDLLARIDAQRAPWMVSNAALAAAISASLADRHVEHVRATLQTARLHLASVLGELGLPIVPSTTTYLLCRTGEADALRERLLRRHGLLVRSCTSFGLPDHIRLAARPEADVIRLGRALREELGR